MKRIDKLSSLSIEEFAKYLYENWCHDDDPCIKWWNKTYCSKCEPEIAYVPYLEKEMEYTWCELHGKCRFFQDLDEVPNCKMMMKLWLESEVED